MTVLVLDNFIKKKFSDYFCDYYHDDIITMDATKKEFPMDLGHYTHIILSGSEDSIIDDRDWQLTEMELVRHAVELKIPVLGICYGHQLIAKALFGKGAVRRRDLPELGWKTISRTAADPLFEGLENDVVFFVSHFDEVTETADVEVLSWSDECNIQSMKIKDAPAYGLQFHPEIDMSSGRLFLSDLKDMFPELHLEVEMGLDEARDCTGASRKLFANFYELARG